MIKNTMRKGFTLVELLFVMAIIAILAGFAIANLKDSSKVATVNSIKNDVRNAIAVEQTYFAENQAYDSVDTTANPAVDGSATGDGGAKFSISKGNNLVITTQDCGDGTLGYVIEGENDQYADTVSFDSCNNGSIKHDDGIGA